MRSLISGGVLLLFEELERRLRDILAKRAPGYVELFNIYCMIHYHLDCLVLLFKEPSKLYHIILTHYRGDVVTSDYVFTLIFLGPLAQLLGDYSVVKSLLELAKMGKDREFLEVIERRIKRHEA
jgi:hypothetical protein